MTEIDLDDSPYFTQLKAEKALFTIPKLKGNQLFYCTQCGNCTQAHFYKHVYSQTINMETGEGSELFEHFYVSQCCLADMAVMDNDTFKDIEIDPIHYLPVKDR